MEAFTLVDGIVAVVVILSAILAYSRGLVREVLAIAGWVVAAVVGFVFAPQAEPLVREVPVLSDFLGGNCELSMIAAFAGVFAIALIVMSIFTPLFAGAVQRSALGGVDQGLGFLFGVLRGAVLIAVALLVYERIAGAEGIAMVETSQTRALFGQVTERMTGTVDDQQLIGWVTAQYEALIGACDAPGTPVPAETAPTTPTPPAPATGG
ncbi:MAG: CvpA family protein [Rhodobacteraceae bacterium]|jgi:membrane protein required for colicin V production|nr:CvpA family protein [Paracoccaceae bacterium]